MNVLERGLTDEQARRFESDGYLVISRMLSSQEIDEIRDSFMAENGNGPIPGLSEIVAEWDESDPLSFYPRMMNPHRHPELAVGPLAHKHLLNPRLYPVLSELIGDEPVAVQSMFYFKPPQARGQELHQDNYYLRVKPGTCMAAWIAVDDADAENGGMKVVPGSHRDDVVCPQTADASVSFTRDYVPVPQGLREEQVVLKSGDVLFFNGSLIHGSTPNSSTDRYRRSLIFHYVPLGCAEMAGYDSPTRFDGEVISIPLAEGGGPCGVPVPTGPH